MPIMHAIPENKRDMTTCTAQKAQVAVQIDLTVHQTTQPRFNGATDVNERAAADYLHRQNQYGARPRRPDERLRRCGNRDKKPPRPETEYWRRRPLSSVDMALTELACPV